MKLKSQAGLPMWIIFLIIALIVLVIIAFIISGAGQRIIGVNPFP